MICVIAATVSFNLVHKFFGEDLSICSIVGLFLAMTLIVAGYKTYKYYAEGYNDTLTAQEKLDLIWHCKLSHFIGQFHRYFNLRDSS